jgi:uncharacterized membrane protein
MREAGLGAVRVRGGRGRGTVRAIGLGLTALAVLVGAGCRRAPRPRVVEWTALGTEPFWSVEVATHALTLRRPGASDVVVPPVPPSPVVPHGADPRDTAAVVARVWRSRAAAGSPLLEVVVMRGDCRDGMSDRVYPASATARWGDTTYTGCALPGRPGDAALK